MHWEGEFPWTFGKSNFFSPGGGKGGKITLFRAMVGWGWEEGGWEGFSGSPAPPSSIFLSQSMQGTSSLFSSISNASCSGVAVGIVCG